MKKTENEAFIKTKKKLYKDLLKIWEEEGSPWQEDMAKKELTAVKIIADPRIPCALAHFSYPSDPYHAMFLASYLEQLAFNLRQKIEEQKVRSKSKESQMKQKK